MKKNCTAQWLQIKILSTKKIIYSKQKDVLSLDVYAVPKFFEVSCWYASDSEEWHVALHSTGFTLN